MIPGSIPGFVVRHQGRPDNTERRDVTPDTVALFDDTSERRGIPCVI